MACCSGQGSRCRGDTHPSHGRWPAGPRFPPPAPDRLGPWLQPRPRLSGDGCFLPSSSKWAGLSTLQVMSSRKPENFTFSSRAPSLQFQSPGTTPPEEEEGGGPGSEALLSRRRSGRSRDRLLDRAAGARPRPGAWLWSSTSADRDFLPRAPGRFRMLLGGPPPRGPPPRRASPGDRISTSSLKERVGEALPARSPPPPPWWGPPGAGSPRVEVEEARGRSRLEKLDSTSRSLSEGDAHRPRPAAWRGRAAAGGGGVNEAPPPPGGRDHSSRSEHAGDHLLTSHLTSLPPQLLTPSPSHLLSFCPHSQR